ncbi:MAG: acetyl-CoA decarbonylase/synthase complex subunit alpha/beta [Candidatus Methanomethylophilaceae archaeon]|nr:acetyl-CoA decarbonylase/synthase complex subunit alpha/beta [Candidatus Methanomethylophilaceae archaeon]
MRDPTAFSKIASKYGIDSAEEIPLLLEAVRAHDVPSLLALAAEGSDALVSLAKKSVMEAIRGHGGNTVLEYPETGYGVPSVCAWKGTDRLTLEGAFELLESLGSAKRSALEDGLAAGESAMYAADILEAITYIGAEEADRDGFIPDRVIRELGLSLVDETIPGAAVFLGDTGNENVILMAKDIQSKGMLGLVTSGTQSLGYAERMRDNDVAMGLDRMMYPLGGFAGVVHALNFDVRAALTFGGVAPGDRERLSAYLAKRPKAFVIKTGELNRLESALAFAALMHSAPIVTDSDLPDVPGAIRKSNDLGRMVQVGIEERGIIVTLEPLDLPVGYGPSFEGEVLRKPDTYFEAGGSRSTAFELLVSRDENEIEDGKILLIGKDLDEIPEGSVMPLAMIVEVYGKDMQSDLESVMERRFHSGINFAEGIWHTGQRNSDWVRISKKAVGKGFRLAHLGKMLMHATRKEFGSVVTRVQVTIITDLEEIECRLPAAKEIYDARDERMKGLKDELVDCFYTCTMCQSFAPGHICIISPERLGLCGAINWLDAKAGNELSPSGPNKPVSMGDLLDGIKGEWAGVNDSVSSASSGTVTRMCLYSLMDAPMTSCGCFEVIIAMTVDMQSVILVDRDYLGMTPVGMKFSTLAGSIGGGRQTPGFMGVGRKYIISDKFIAAEGGLPRISWMPRRLKDMLGEELRKRCRDLGMPDLMDKIADETITDNAEGLMAWMAEVDHPALRMEPLI